MRGPGAGRTKRIASLGSIHTWKKSLTETKTAPHKRRKSPIGKRPYGESTGSAGSAPSTTRLRAVNTNDGSLMMSDREYSHDESEMVTSSLSGINAASNGGGSSDATGEDVDCHDGSIDPDRTQAALQHLLKKIDKTMGLIKIEQNAKEENVNEYLRLSTNADKQQVTRIKTVFEKKNQLSTKSIATLQKKLEHYQGKQREVETYGVSSHKLAKEVLKDMGQGLKGVVDNIRGAKETIVSKPKEIAYRFKNKFGSADNINNLKNSEDGQCSTDDGEKPSHHGSGTLPPRFHFQSDDDASSVTSGSAVSATQSSPHPTLPQNTSLPQNTTLPHSSQFSESEVRSNDRGNFDPILRQLHEHREFHHILQNRLENVKGDLHQEVSTLRQVFEEERDRSERLEEQINDLTELHQHEVTNIKQELSSMEEKMEYQLEERTRDMQELLETCQTRITKMELQQQQQQLISMEGIENSNFRALITKLINVLLAVLAVVLVLVSTIANLLGPFLTTRIRILSTVCLVACMVATWQNWTIVKDFGQHIADQYGHILPFR